MAVLARAQVKAVDYATSAAGRPHGFQLCLDAGRALVHSAPGNHQAPLLARCTLPQVAALKRTVHISTECVSCYSSRYTAAP